MIYVLRKDWPVMPNLATAATPATTKNDALVLRLTGK